MAPPCRMASRLGHSRLISMVIVFRGAGGRALQRAVTSLTVLGLAASPTLVGVAASQRRSGNVDSVLGSATPVPRDPPIPEACNT